MSEITTNVNRSTSGEVIEQTKERTQYIPRVDIYETDDELVFACDMPGAKPDDIDLRFENGELTIHGRVREEESGRKYFLHEYGLGDFYRSFTVNEAIDPDRISAEYKRGVLTVHLPKKEEAKPKKIAIKTE